MTIISKDATPTEVADVMLSTLNTYRPTVEKLADPNRTPPNDQAQQNTQKINEFVSTIDTVTQQYAQTKNTGLYR